MRTAKLTFEEAQAAEQAAAARRQSRKQGFNKMQERDHSTKMLSNGVLMVWHVNRELGERIAKVPNLFGDDRDIEVVTYPPEISTDSFALVVDGKMHVFDLEEFRRSLRWA